jgi:probable phosphoglycerate mutase
VHLIFVRHGQPVVAINTDGTIADPDLSDLGRWQAERVSAWLGHEPVDAIVTSPKQRAKSTVAGLITSTGLEPTVIDDLDEIDRGASVYHPTERLPLDGGDYWKAITEQRWDDIGWDSPESFGERVGAAFDDLASRRLGERVVVACHGGTIRFIVAKVLGLQGAGRMTTDYASITRIEVGDDASAKVVSTNETAHFDADRSGTAGVWNSGAAPGSGPPQL